MHFPSLDKDQRRILQALRRLGSLSRSALAIELEMSATALTRLSRDLLSLGLIEEVPDNGAQGRGRPAVPLRLVPGGPRASAAGALSHMWSPGRGADWQESVVAGSQLGVGRNSCLLL
mgnify:CR=1 FL=1